MHNKSYQNLVALNTNHFIMSWVCWSGIGASLAWLADLLFHKVLLEATQRHLPGTWANSFMGLTPCRDNLKAGMCWVCPLELFHMASPVWWWPQGTTGLCESGQQGESWGLLWPSHRSQSYCITPSMLSWKKHSSASLDQGEELWIPHFNGRSVKKFVEPVPKLTHTIWVHPSFYWREETKWANDQRTL
jgi:hypothetical protein